jgi:hypothetical protein
MREIDFFWRSEEMSRMGDFHLTEMATVEQWDLLENNEIN